MTTSSDSASGEPQPRVYFDAVLMPHRSLSPAGFWLLMAVISALSFVSGMYFVWRGAWPVSGYLGLDILLVYIAFKASYRSARLHEAVRLTEEALVVERVGPSGRLGRWTFQPYWLRIEMDDPAEHHSQLKLTSHGRFLVIGAFLAPHERLEVANALRAALGRQRSGGPASAWAAGAEATEAG